MAATIRLRNKKTKDVQVCYAVDAREILAVKDTDWELAPASALAPHPNLDAQEKKPSAEAVEAERSKFTRGGATTTKPKAARDKPKAAKSAGLLD